MTRTPTKTPTPIVLTVLALALAARGQAFGAQAGAGVAIHRFALIAASNDGGGERPKLRYAGSDARSVAKVLHDLGGMRPDEQMLLLDVTRASLRAGFTALRDRIRATQTPKTRVELLVYYSGHSDEEGLLLGGGRVGYAELRSWIEEAGADVRIAILDSCSSGALTRSKGGLRRPPFLSDVSSQAKGHAFLTASSANEAAQESDRIGAAFFTHYLVSGMRGAADTSHDGRVTLQEAYDFAFRETLERTERTRTGPQHPTYDIQLAGSGELVMTDLRGTSASLVLPDPVAGRLFVRDTEGKLLAELRKTPGYPVELGLEPGRYRVTLDFDRKLYETDVEVKAGTRTLLAQAEMVPVKRQAATARGDEPAEAASSDAAIFAAAPPGTPYKHIPFALSLVPTVSTNRDDRAINNFVLGFISDSYVLQGAQLGLFGNVVRENARGAQVAGTFNFTGGGMVGAQLGGGANVALGGFEGAQVTGGANIARGDAHGGQVAGGANLALGSLRGAQVAGGFNLAGRIEGVQIAPVNIAGEGRGAQLGVVNITGKRRGVMLGVVNVADDAEGLVFGLVSYVKTGYHPVVAWSTDASLANVGWKTGTHHFYTLLGMGAHPVKDGTDRIAAHFGLGFHLTPAERLFFDVDALATQFADAHSASVGFGEGADRQNVLGSLRLQVGYQIARHLAVIGGPTANVLTSWGGTDAKVGFAGAGPVWHDGDTTVRLYPGFVLGVQI